MMSDDQCVARFLLFRYFLASFGCWRRFRKAYGSLRAFAYLPAELTEALRIAYQPLEHGVFSLRHSFHPGFANVDQERFITGHRCNRAHPTNLPRVFRDCRNDQDMTSAFLTEREQFAMLNHPALGRTDPRRAILRRWSSDGTNDLADVTTLLTNFKKRLRVFHESTAVA